jgi:hypothetical protein
MNIHRNEVRSRYPGALAEYRVAMSQRGRDQVGYWAIVERRDGENKLLARGESEAAAWEAATVAGLLDTIVQ